MECRNYLFSDNIKWHFERGLDWQKFDAGARVLYGYQDYYFWEQKFDMTTLKCKLI